MISISYRRIITMMFHQRQGQWFIHANHIHVVGQYFNVDYVLLNA